MKNKRYLDIGSVTRRSRIMSLRKKTYKLSKEKKTLLIKGAVFFILFGAIVLFGMFAWISRTLPDENDIKNSIVAENTIIYDRTGEHILYEIYGDEKRTIVPFSDFPDYLQKAFIAVEDQQFYTHNGFNLWGIIRCGIKGLVGQLCGGSTITQQYIKNAILGNKRTPTRKIKELILSYALEKKFNKNQILEKYLNTIPFGSNYYGVEAAAQGYFGKASKDLTLAEAATLAAMVQRPSYYSPYGNNVDKLKQRMVTALDLMKNEGYINDQQVEEAKKYKLEFKENITNITAPHFVFYIKEQLVEQFGETFIEKGGLKVYTTLDYDKQKIAEETIKNNETRLAESEANNVSLVAIDPRTSQILTMVGSRDYFNDEIDGKVNVALRPRQPGSSIKPLVYVNAFEKGYTPETIFFDTNAEFSADASKSYQPKNYDEKEVGPITLARALGGSRNLPAVKLLYMIGVDEFISFAEKIGYTTFTDRSRFGLSLVLGGGEVKLLEHTLAYATIANKGVRKDVSSILRIEDKSKNTIFEWKDTPGEQVIDTNAVAALDNVLSNNENRSWVFGQNNLLVVPGHTVAAKTGTTNSYVDGWLMGYTPSIAAGVWVGNTDNTPMRRGDGGSRVAGPIWNEFMKGVLQNTKDEAFPTYTPKKNDKPLFNGVPFATEYIAIDQISGKRANENTPKQAIIKKPFTIIHDILHYVDRSDPLGPIPTNPSADPQYQAWEDGLQKWLEANKTSDIIKGLNLQEPPTEFDTIHTSDQKPNIVITEPQNNSSVEDIFSVNIRYSTKQPAQKIEYYIDDQKIQTNQLQNTIGDMFYNTNIHIPLGVPAGTHVFKVRIFDQIDNTETNSININLQRTQTSLNTLNWRIESNIDTSLFPLTIQTTLNGPKDQIKQIDFFYTDPVSDIGGFIDYALPTENINITWKNPPEPGTYRLYAIITTLSGETYHDPGSSIIIKEAQTQVTEETPTN